MLELLEKEGEKEERKEEKKNPPFPFYPTFHFGGTSVVFLPDSHFARQQYTSSRRFDAVFRRIDTRGGGLFSAPPPLFIRRPSDTPLNPAWERGGGKAKMYFSRTIRGNRKSSPCNPLPAPKSKVRFLNVIRPESVLQFSHR